MVLPVYTTKILGNIFRHNSKDGCRQVNIKLRGYDVVILHPSMCCPLILDPAQRSKPISIIIATDEHFYKDYKSQDTEGKDKSNWDFRVNISRTIARFIKIQQWFKGGGAEKDSLIKEDALVGACTAETVSVDTLRNFACTYLGPLERELTRTSGEGNKPLSVFRDEKQKEDLFALMREETVAYFKERGLAHVFEIQIHGLNLQPDSLYEISWVIRGEAIADRKNRFYEKQDVMTFEYLSRDPRIPLELSHKGFKVDKSGIDFTPTDEVPLENHHFIWVAPSGKQRLDIGHLTDVHVSARQHVFKKSKAQMIPGVSPEIGTQVHASFDSLKDLMDQFGAGPNAVDLLIVTGDLIDYNRNYNPKEFEKTQGKTGDIWQEMNLNHLNRYDEKQKKLFDNNIKYPRSIDDLTIYSLFVYYYKTYGKPILLTSGNHEGYTLPYGIASRVKVGRALLQNAQKFAPIIPAALKPQHSEVHMSEVSRRDAVNDRKEIEKKKNPDIYGQRANDGVSADHNLTMPEAILMYGPDYARVVASGGYPTSGTQNFRHANYDWIYTVFTPISDFILQYKDQLFLGLDWGKGEIMAAVLDGQVDGFWGGGILPRATESLDTFQVTLIEHALSQPHPCKMLLTHFTLVNFNNHITLQQTGAVHYGSKGKDGVPTHYDVGTFEKNRYALYQPLKDGKFAYTLAGHSHRAALYYQYDAPWYTDVGYAVTSRLRTAVNTNPLQIATNDVKTIPMAAELAQPATQLSQKYDTAKVNGATRIMVSASGGPIAVQNRNLELANWGLDYPSGSFIRFSGTQEQALGVIRPRPHIKTAKPRLAVAMDYADTIGKEKDKEEHGIFESIMTHDLNEPFIVKVNPRMKLPQVEWIKEAVLYVYEGKTKSKLKLTIKKNQLHMFSLSIDANKLIIGDIIDSPQKYTLQLAIHFDDAIKVEPFAHYDISAPWIFFVELLDHTSLQREYYDNGREVIQSWHQDSPELQAKYLQGNEQMKNASIEREHARQARHRTQANQKQAAVNEHYNRLADIARYQHAKQPDVLQQRLTAIEANRQKELAKVTPDKVIPEKYQYRIVRHRAWGEVPNHRWYSENFGAEYVFPWRDSRRTEKDNKLNS